MSSSWHWFVILGTLGTLVAMLLMLWFNRKTSGDPTTGHEWDGITELDNPLPMWWVWMFLASIVFAIVVLIYYPGLGNLPGVGDWSAVQQHDRDDLRHDTRFAPLYAELGASTEDELHADQRAQQVGRRLFLNHCATCHGMNAFGGFGFPNLNDSFFIWPADFAATKATITDGRNAVMPGWAAALDERASLQTAEFVRSLGNLPHNAEQAALGATHYQLFCSACHMPEGTGTPALGAPDLTDSSWLYGNSVEQLMFTIRNGRQGNMPAHGDILTPAEVHILAAYVTGLRSQ